MLVYQRVSPVETTSQSRTPLAIGSHAVWVAVWAIDRHIHMIVTPTNCNMPPPTNYGETYLTITGLASANIFNPSPWFFHPILLLIPWCPPLPMISPLGSPWYHHSWWLKSPSLLLPKWLFPMSSFRWCSHDRWPPRNFFSLETPKMLPRD